MKAKLWIGETVKFSHRLEVEADDEEKVKEACERIERARLDCLDDACLELEKVEGLKIIDRCVDDSGDPDKVEVIDWYEE